MDRRKFIAASALMAPMALAAEVTKSVQTKEGQGETIMADWLFVQNAKNFTYANGKLTMHGEIL